MTKTVTILVILKLAKANNFKKAIKKIKSFKKKSFTILEFIKYVIIVIKNKNLITIFNNVKSVNLKKALIRK